MITYALLLIPTEGGRAKCVGVLTECGATRADVWGIMPVELVRTRASGLIVELPEATGTESSIAKK